MAHKDFPGFRLGIAGGGQLGRMLCIEARRMGIHTTSLDPDPQAPARGISDRFIQGSLHDPASLKTLAAEVDALTLEIEHVDVATLQAIEDSGIPVYPRPATLARIQDKGLQKSLLRDAGIPVPSLELVDGPSVRSWEPARYPVVQKLRKGGYDGRGVQVLRSPNDSRLQGDSLMEEAVDIALELAVLMGRDPQGRTAVYSLVEMAFDPAAQICSSVVVPARVSPSIASRAVEIGVETARVLDVVGVLAVELFLDTQGRILVNEVAPRPHNSGHWTIEGAVTSQFAMHLRAVCGLPLGDPSLVRPSAMVNLLGAPGAQGEPLILGYPEACTIPGFAMHWYQKSEVKPLRKMGHATVCASTVEEAWARAIDVQRLLRVEGRNPESKG